MPGVGYSIGLDAARKSGVANPPIDNGVAIDPSGIGYSAGVGSAIGSGVAKSPLSLDKSISSPEEDKDPSKAAEEAQQMEEKGNPIDKDGIGLNLAKEKDVTPKGTSIDQNGIGANLAKEQDLTKEVKDKGGRNKGEEAKEKDKGKDKEEPKKEKVSKLEHLKNIAGTAAEVLSPLGEVASLVSIGENDQRQPDADAFLKSVGRTAKQVGNDAKDATSEITDTLKDIGKALLGVGEKDSPKKGQGEEKIPSEKEKEFEDILKKDKEQTGDDPASALKGAGASKAEKASHGDKIIPGEAMSDEVAAKKGVAGGMGAK